MSRKEAKGARINRKEKGKRTVEMTTRKARGGFVVAFNTKMPKRGSRL